MNGVGWGQLWALTCDFSPCLSLAVCCCCNRVPEVEGFTVKTNLFLTVMEAKSKTKGPESGEECLSHLAADNRRKSGREEGRKGRDKAKPQAFVIGVNLILIPRTPPPSLHHCSRVNFPTQSFVGHSQNIAMLGLGVTQILRMRSPKLDTQKPLYFNILGYQNFELVRTTGKSGSTL